MRVDSRPVRRSLTLLYILLFSSWALAIPASALDGDSDGYDDSVDDCPLAWGNSSTGSVGCPDSDGDGRADFETASTTDWDDAVRATNTYFTSGRARTVTWSPDGWWFVAAGDGGDIELFRSTGVRKATLHTSTHSIRDVAFSPNGSLLAYAAYDSGGYPEVKVIEIDWSTLSGNMLRDLSSYHSGDNFAVAFSQDGSLLYTGGANMRLNQFDSHNWTRMTYWSLPDPVYNIHTSPDDRLVAVTHGQELSVFWTVNGTRFMNRHNHSGTVTGLDWTPDGRYLVTTGSDGRFFGYDIWNRTTAGAGGGGSWGNLIAVSISPDGGHFVVARNSGATTTYMFDLQNWSYLYTWGSFSASQSSQRGARDVGWAPDGTRIVFATNRGRAAMYANTDAYIHLIGEITSQLMLNRWSSNWNDDGRLLDQTNTSTIPLTSSLCNGEDVVGTISHGIPHHLATPLANWSSSGRLDCTQTSAQLLEVPVGRMPATLFVQAGGAAESCLRSVGGLSMGQLRWIFSGASTSTFTQPGVLPAMDLGSIAPSLDSDGLKEWSDLHPSCSQDPIHVTGRWDNRSVPMMMERMLTCSDCEFPENFFVSSTSRFRFEEELRSQIVFSVSQTDHLLGFTELEVGLAAPNLYDVPIVDNWTHGAQDVLAGGGTAIIPSATASMNGSWPVQDDYYFIIDAATLPDRFQLLDWMLSDSAQSQWESMGFVRMGIYDRVQAWARIGVNATHLLPDGDGDGVWDGEDDCPGTDEAWTKFVDELGCAQNQLDDDADGVVNSDDDCQLVWGNSTTPTIGCPDRDGDGVADTNDVFPDDETQWRDFDADGYGDNQSAGASEPDSCSDVWGNSTRDRFGCPDTDGDGWSDEDGDWLTSDGADAFPLDKRQWVDSDADGYGDNHSYTLDDDGLREDEQGDAWPSDPFRWSDTDGDLFSDQAGGILPDSCPLQAGSSTEMGRLGCPDADGDGYADVDDDFVDDPTQWEDTDGDGYGDRWNGNDPDDCVETPFYEIDDVDENGCGPSERDSDADGINDAYDDCPDTLQSEVALVDQFGCSNSQRDDDGDGVNNPLDAFPDDPTQAADSDGDGRGDNASGNNGDDCPSRQGYSTRDRRGCPDTDGDGFSDPDGTWSESHGADAVKHDATQWADSDGDGFFDNWDDSTWNASRQYGWPGEFVPGATAADKCPLNSSSLAHGCPAVTSTGPTTTTTRGSEGGLPLGLWIAIGLALLVIVGLTAAVTLNSRKPKRRRKGRDGVLDQALQTVDEAAEDWAQEAAPEAADGPHWEVQGVPDAEGFEWLEWPENSDRWWFRDESGYWAPYE